MHHCLCLHQHSRTGHTRVAQAKLLLQHSLTRLSDLRWSDLASFSGKVGRHNLRLLLDTEGVSQAYQFVRQGGPCPLEIFSLLATPGVGRTHLLAGFALLQIRCAKALSQGVA
jgi:hypothetical protein